MRWYFTIPGRLPGLNEIIAANRMHRQIGAKQKRAVQEPIAYIAKRSVPILKVQVHLHFHWIEPNNRRDLGNIRAGEKFISDALVQAGCIPDDSAQWIVGMSDTRAMDAKNPRVVVTVEEVPTADAEAA